MHTRSVLLFLVLGGLMLSSCFRNQPLSPKKVLLHENWTFHRAGSDTALHALVPGNIHLDLLNNGRIPDPYFGLNEQQVQWVEKEDWTYRTRFRANSMLLDYKHIHLVFDGLDTYADVYLNDSLVLQADNMFRQWKIDVKGLLKNGFNDLAIVFHSPVRINREKASLLPYELPDERAFSRKAPYMFGWDWGPRLVTSGIWKPVYIETWEDVKIKDWKVVTDSLGEELARMRLILNVNASDSMEIEYTCKFSRNDRETVPLKLAPGENRVEIPFSIDDPKLWWTHSLGEPFLYDFSVSLKKNNKDLDRMRDRFGIRTLEWINEPDGSGSAFYFKLNGVPVFMKGANYIPQDNFPSRVKAEQYDELLESARRANMNMLRVWGGGIYEEDVFYDLCDRNGILVWQDFMFAGTMYPGDSVFLNNVKQEARQQVTRLRNHPSLALWCGNNEIDEGWHNWGWQTQFGYSEPVSDKLWADYQALFHQILPDAVAECDGATAYWPSSPQHGWGRKESLTDGDMHYWGVWWGGEPFSSYNNKVGRFMSEYGFQGYPPYRTLRESISEENLSVGSPEMRHHQKHPFGEEMILEFIKRSYPVPPADSLEDYVYLSQLTQAYGIQTALEAHRRAMPYCMGTLYWQLNDCWPVVSWSSLDHKNRWKALHYFATRAFMQLMISPLAENGSLEIFIIHDDPEDKAAKLELATLDFQGNILSRDSVNITIKGNSSASYYTGKIEDLVAEERRKTTFARILLIQEGDTLARNNYYFSPPDEMELLSPDIRFTMKEEKERIRITLYSEVLVKDLFLQFEGSDGWFSDNFFDLLPGEAREILFYPVNEDILPDSQAFSFNHLQKTLQKY